MMTACSPVNPSQKETPSPSSKKTSAWTPEETNALIAVYSDRDNNLTLEEISEAFGRPPKEILQHKTDLKLGDNRKPGQQLPGLNYHSVKRGSSFLVLPKRPPVQIGKRWTPEEITRLETIFSDPLNDLSIAKIAALFGRSIKAIERIKEQRRIGSARKPSPKAKNSVRYNKVKPGTSLKFAPAFSLSFSALPKPGEPVLAFQEFLHPRENTSAPIITTHATQEQEQKELLKAGTPWSEWDKHCLQHYWRLRALGVRDVALFLQRTPEEVNIQAKRLKLPEKTEHTPSVKYRIDRQWDINAEIVVKSLSSDEQHALAELTATRMSHLRTNPLGTKGSEKSAHSEVGKLFEIQRHIFNRVIRNKARKLAAYFANPAAMEVELFQIGETSLFDCLDRWNPAEGINFSRGTVAMNIERDMQKWLQNNRLVRLPSGLIQEIVEERKVVNGFKEKDPDLKQTSQRKSSINRYIFSVHPERAIVPLTEVYPDDNEHPEAHQTACGLEITRANKKSSGLEADYQSYHEPSMEKEIMLKAVSKLFASLPPPQRYAFCQYNGIGEDGSPIPNKNLRELSEETGVTKERIRQRINLARASLTKKLMNMGIRCTADALGV